MFRIGGIEMKYNKYTFFKPNQLLSDSDLNDNFNYLDERDRLTRVDLIGTGIVCGLEPSFTTNGNLSISKGYGITTDGYIIKEEQEVILRHYIDNINIDITEKETIICAELFLNSTSGSKPVVRQNYDNKVLMLYLNETSKSSKNNDDCTAIEKGDKITFAVRYLLIEKDDLDQIVGEKCWPDVADTFILEKKLLSRVCLQLPQGEDEKFIDIDKFTVLNSFIAPLKTEEGIAKNIKDILVNAYNIFKPILTQPSNPFDDLGQQSKFTEAFSWLWSPELLSSERALFYQNYYDFFNDLLSAYEEFRQCGLELLRTCCISKKPFPRYLILGDFSKPASPSSCRHYFQPSTVEKDCTTEKVRHLFDRIVTMVQYFFNPSFHDSEVRLTPSVYGTVPLSDKAIPYYYKKDDDALCDVWDNRKEDYADRIGYWYKHYNSLNYLDYDFERYNFIRIEGHVNQQADTVVSNLQKLKKEYCLPIEIITLRTGNIEPDGCISDFQKLQFEVLRRETTAALQQLKNKLLAILRKKRELAQRAQDKKEKAEQKKNEADVALNAAIHTENEVAARDRAEQAEVELNSATKKADAELNAAEKAKQDADIVKSAKDTTLGIQFPPKNDVDSELYSKLFAIPHIDSGIAVALLHWLDTAMTTYQNCLRRHHLTSLASFIEKHPGLQHKSGVPIGGTFILVHDGSNVIADFCLPYRVTQPD